MTKTALKAFRTTLGDIQTELGRGNRNREGLAIESSPDELDRIQHASDRDWTMSNLERNSNRLREVRAALCRIDEGTFGVCVGCEADINTKRLAAVPWASFCIVCQDAADREQKIHRYEIGSPLATAA